MKSKLAIILLIFLVPTAASQVTYDIRTSPQSATISTDVNLDCNRFKCPILTWKKPAGFELVNITDSQGLITDYEESSDRVEINTGSPNNGGRKIVTINFRTSESAKEIYEGLYKRSFSLSGFSDKELRGKVQSSNLISGDIGYNFRSSYGGDYFNLTGQGPVNIDVNFGDGQKTDHYVFFGQYPDVETSEAYEISVGTTGRVQKYENIPVAVIPAETYNRTQTSWSSGEYSAGTIRMRANLDQDQFNPTLARETVHALNNDLLDWDQTKSSYIDEGTSEFVGYLMERRQVPVDQRPERVRRLFGDQVSYTTTIDGQRYRIGKPSRGNRETLWNYYQQDAEFMKTWTPGDSDYRSFGYAYSELIIRHNLIEEKMKLSDLYNYFEYSERVESPEKKWSILSQNLDMTPCKTDNRTQFDNCLDRVNEHYRFQAYTADPDRGDQKLVINETETPEYNQSIRNESLLDNVTNPDTINGRETFGTFLQNLLQYISETLRDIFNIN